MSQGRTFAMLAGLMLASAVAAQDPSTPAETPAPEPAPAAETPSTPEASPAPQPDLAETPTIPVAEASTQKLEEVVVTAQKRVQRLVDVPINVSSMSEKEVRETRIEQVRDVASFIPNVDIKEQVPGGIPVVSIRGVSLDDFSSTNSPAAGVYVDQVTLSSLALMSFDLYDIERIEVLKGPQGTLYGRNSTAGAINIISARPTFHNEAYFTAGYGNYKTSNVEGMLNLPLGDQLAFRIAGKYIRQGQGFWQSRRGSAEQDPGGLVTVPTLPVIGQLPRLPVPPVSFGTDTSNDPIVRDIGRRDIILGRAHLLWDATTDLRFDLKVEGERSRSEMGQPEQFGSLCQPNFTPIDPDHCSDALGYSDRDRDPYKGDWRGDFPYTIDQLGETLTAEWDLGWATLSSVSGYISMRRFFHIDVDGSPADEFDFFQHDNVKQFTQELRLAGTSDLVDWLGGVFWSKDHVVVYTPGDHEDLIPNEHTIITADQHTKSAAAFVNGDWHLTKRLGLTTGLRYTYETRAYVGGTTWTVTVPNEIESTHQDSSIMDHNWSWKAGLNFAPTKRSLIYANASKGIKSGGYFSGVTNNNGQLNPYKPEHLTAYEIGAKTSGMFSVNGSLFYYDYHDVQVFMRSSDVPAQFIGNVDKAHLYGVDLEAMLRAGGLTLRAGGGLLKSYLGSFPSPSGGGLVSVPGSPPPDIPAGNRLANAPERTLSGLARYEFPLFSTNTLIGAQADAHYSSMAFKEATNDPLIASGSYVVYNARLSLLSAQRNWEVAFWGRNLGNRLYVSQGLDIGVFFFGNRNYNAPRTFGADFTFSFF
ncbi:MAG TPA: TonB-dependent receptor [Nevskiaceae bacterium]|nr:TonB-dependent receptor [Nevskiaceae bacterium]